ncbi:hypothetical protein SAMN04487949_2834 [Halogranum gelatinilyticum]|uniref:DNA-binding transcriptional regulator GbsR, MarR family n=1 Tax=Halogranum gelatinilyticum TaxID=660521 RepID=A0A1G9X4G1_9EURY|nr:ArsR family transcriptional regulator [Halogranum gelatinilyticum]SDM91592.1 hypothetical protein SAMN04487949_2834 [Halogranum gelatinilyticum]
MSGEPPTDRPQLADEWESSLSGRSTRERVYETALQLYDPTRVSAVADRADVSAETARDYLQWFAEMGILTEVSSSPATYRRNDSYFQWRRVQELRDKPLEELETELRELTDQERSYRDRFGVDAPGDVDALEHADYDEVEDVWMTLQEWQTVRRRIREVELARRDRDGTAEASA